MRSIGRSSLNHKHGPTIPLTRGGVPIPAGWTTQRLDTFGTAGSIPGPIRLHTLYNESIYFDLDGTNRIQIPNTVINNQQQQYQHFEDATWSFLSDRLRIQGRGQGDGSIKSGQIASTTAYRSFIFEARLTIPSTLGTWAEFWAYASTGGGDTSELDVEILASMDGSFLTVHDVSLGNHGAFAAPTIDDSHVVYNAGGIGLTIYHNAAFNFSTGPHYYTIYYDDTGAGEVRRYIDGVLMYHAVGKWNNSLGGTGFGPDAALILDLAVGSGVSGGQFPGTVTSPSTWTGDMDIYSIGIYAPGAAGRAIPTGEAWSTFKDASLTLSGGDLVATGTVSRDAIIYAFDSMYTGKYYWEIILSSNSCAVGIGCHDNFGFTYLGDFGGGVGWYGAGRGADAGLWCNGAKVANWESYSTTPARLCLAVHVVAEVSCKFWGRVGAAGNWNNDVIGNQNPATDLGGFDLPFSAFRLVTVVPAASTFSPGDILTMVAASGSWVGTPPAGFGQIGPT